MVLATSKHSRFYIVNGQPEIHSIEADAWFVPVKVEIEIIDDFLIRVFVRGSADGHFVRFSNVALAPERLIDAPAWLRPVFSRDLPGWRAR